MQTTKIFFVLVAGFIFQCAETEASRADNKLTTDPHFMYMQRLFEHLSDNVIIPLEPGDSLQGKLIATSIETLNAEGRGLSEMGFIFEETNQLNLQFVIPKHSNDGDTFPDVELWVFPDKSQVSRDTLLEIRYVAKADIPEASSPRMHQSLQLWDTNEDCIALNLTILSKKIYKVLQKRSLKESNVSVTIEITNVKESTRNHTADALHHDLCTSLSQRGSNQSFLIIKNYADQSIHRLFDAENLEANTSSVKKREAINDIANNSTASDSCRVVSLIVNLTEVYGDFIKAPVMTDIKDCSGECTSYKRNLFSKHAEIKERLKLLPGGSQLSEFEPSCVPLRYRPLNVHISLRNKPSYVIVQLPDLIVDKCACQ